MKKKDVFCTDDDNIIALLNEIDTSELPKSFYDALQVVWGLAVPYLWIGSPCIIHGNQKDWLYEGKHMEEVFTSAYCTIATNSALDSYEGFPERKISSDYIHVLDTSGR